MTAGESGASTNLTAGDNPATTAKSAPNLPATCLVTSSVTTTSTITVIGGTCRIMATSGFLLASPPDGRPTASDIGYGWRRGDGPGSKMSRGVLLHFTTGAGRKSVEVGAGF